MTALSPAGTLTTEVNKRSPHEGLDMRWTRMGDRKVRPSQRTCRHCNRIIRSGQTALQQDLPRNGTDPTLLWHVSCIKEILAEAPPDADEESFIELRDRIAATGLAFPDMETTT